MILAIIIATLSLLIAPSLALATDTPIQISPVDNSTITQLKPKLTWQYSGNCPIDTKISCFRVELDMSLLFPNPKYNYTNSFSYSPQTLADGKWFWRVKAKETSGTWSDWSATWSFTLTATTTSPAPDPTSPTDTTPSPTPQTSPTPTSAFTIADVPSQINSDESFNVSVNLSSPDNPNTKFYLKVAFKKAGSFNYFGLTKVSGNWIKNGSGYSDQFPATTDSSGNWSGNLEVKPDSEDSGFTGTGDYIFKVGKYNSADTNPSVSWSNNELTIKIMSTESDQDTTSTETISPASNPSTTSPFPVKKPTTSNKSSKSKSYDTLVYHSASVAAATASARSSTPSAEVEVKNQRQTNPIIWVGLILIFAGASSIGYIYLKKNAKIPF